MKVATKDLVEAGDDREVGQWRLGERSRVGNGWRLANAWIWQPALRQEENEDELQMPALSGSWCLDGAPASHCWG